MSWSSALAQPRSQFVDRLFADLRIVEALPAWHSNRVSRLVKNRKRYLVDPALVAVLLGADSLAVMSDGGLLGRILETFVLAQLRPLRDQLGSRFVAGVVLTRGRAVYPLGERITAVPIAAPWTPDA